LVMDPAESPLLTDLYQLNMIQAYLDHGETRTAVFEFFVRKLPPQRGFLVAAGLEQALDFLGGLRFAPGSSTGSGRVDASETASSTIWPNCASPATCTPCPRAPCSSPTSRSCA
jgi:hypothetical protein